MSEEEMQRKMEFIVEQQAQFVVDIQRLQEAHKQAESRMERIEDVMLRLANIQVQTNANVEALTQRMSEIAQAQVHTDQRLNVLIDIISEGRKQ